jgi:hypothetical protein
MSAGLSSAARFVQMRRPMNDLCPEINVGAVIVTDIDLATSDINAMLASTHAGLTQTDL